MPLPDREAARPAPAPACPTPRRRSETILAGPAGEERPDYTFRYDPEGAVRETIVHFYGADRRAAEARPGDALRREAVYPGRVDTYRLYAARKLSDLHYVGEEGLERRDRRIDYLANGRVSQTVVFYYEQDAHTAKPAPAQGTGEQNQIKRVEAKGGVTVVQKDQNATGDTATFNMKENTVTLLGNVVVTRGHDIIRGHRLVVDLTTGVSRMDGGRVEGLFPSAARGAEKK